MPSAAKMEAIRALIGASPDTVLASLATALRGADGALAEVATMVEQEQAVRRLRAVVFAPVLPLFAPRPDGVPAPLFPRSLLKDLWRAVMDAKAEVLEEAARQIEDWDPDMPAPPVLDELCLDAARRCDHGATMEFRGRDGGESARELALYLRLAPFGRRALARLGDWLGKATDERAAVLRLIFKDAAAVYEDSAPRLMEIIQAHLPEAQLVLRPISLITERASDRYLASSELAPFGERLLGHAEGHVERLSKFDPRGGPASARIAAADVQAAGAILGELEHSIDLARDGPWGRRAAAARKAMASMIEARLRECQRAVEHALPMQPVRLTGRMTRPSPRVSQPPDPRHVEPARALMLLLGETRHAAATGGFGALRAQVAEALSDWLEVYADELVHLINAGEAPDVGVAHQYLELAADFLSGAENDKAAQIVRRRAAVAGYGTSPASQDVA
jgi:hypothetical protein